MVENFKSPFSGDANNPCPLYAPLEPVDIFKPEDQEWLLWWARNCELTASECDALGAGMQGQQSERLLESIITIKRRRSNIQQY